MMIYERLALVGPISGETMPTISGWYLHFDAGSPVSFKLEDLKIHHEGVMIIAMPYPAGTTYRVWLSAVNWCNPNKHLCSLNYQKVNSLDKLIEKTGGPKYFVQDEGDGSETLFVRLFQRWERYLGSWHNSKQWSDNFEVPMITDDTFDWSSVEDRDWGIPFYQYGFDILIDATCHTSGEYCTGGAHPVHIPPTIPNPAFPVPVPQPTLMPSPSTIEEASLCAYIADGSDRNEKHVCSNAIFDDVRDDDIILVNKTMEIAGIRCCDDFGGGFSYCPQGNCQLVDFATAEATCMSNGKRLCTVQEISSYVTEGTGCSYDKLHTWTSDVTVCGGLP